MLFRSLTLIDDLYFDLQFSTFRSVHQLSGEFTLVGVLGAGLALIGVVVAIVNYIFMRRLAISRRARLSPNERSIDIKPTSPRFEEPTT